MTLKELRAKRGRIKAAIEQKCIDNAATLQAMWADHNKATEAIRAAIAAEDADAVKVMVRGAKDSALWVATRCSGASLWARRIGKEDGELRFRRPRQGIWRPRWDCKGTPYCIDDADAVAAVAELEAS